MTDPIRPAAFLFADERRRRCEIARERDLLASASCANRRARHRARIDTLEAMLPQSDAERLLLVFD